jgi:hypothetical protein
LDTLTPVDLLLLEALLMLCSGNLYVVLFQFHIFKLLTFEGVLNSGEEEKVTWGHVWGV